MKLAGSSPICWKKKFLSRNVGIALYDALPREGFERLLSCLPDAVDDADGVYHVQSAGKGAYLLKDPAGNSHFCRSWFEAFYLMDSLVYDVLFPQDKDHFIFHSAAIRHRRSGRVIWLMGPSMSGKSSLSLGLVHSGVFDYLSEEAIGMHPPSGGTLPFPRAWRLRKDCREILGSDPFWEIVRDEHHPRVYVKPPPDVVASGEILPNPSVIYLLNYAPLASSPFFSVATPGVLLANLMTFCVNGITFLTSERIAFLADYCREIPAFTLDWRQFQQTVEAILIKD
jgi:hypothetical protein